MTRTPTPQIGAAPIGANSAALVLLTAALWGGTPVAIRFASDAIPPVTMAGLRFVIATGFMLLWCRWERTGLALDRKQLIWAFGLAVILFLQISTFNIGVQLSNSSHGAMLINTFVFWVVAFEHFVTRSDRLTVRKLTGLTVAGAGVGLILTVDQAAAAGLEAVDAPSLAGDLVLILSAVLLAIRITYTKHALRKMATGKLIFWQDLLGVGLFLAYGMVGESFRLDDLTSAAMWGLLYQGVVVAGFCFAMHASLLRKHSASQLAVFSFTTPLFGVMLASLLRSDRLSAWLLVSAVCVALGIYLVNTGKKKAV
ncbi:MAG: hypothetical protein CMJ75_15715 [Planctomycetaceae bacterium]|nr:hypothetical protein [Planctomycetaceae bacterium]